MSYKKEGSLQSQKKAAENKKINQARREQEAKEKRQRDLSNFGSLSQKDKDRILSQEGLLKWQTEGMSSEQIRDKFAASGIGVQTDWLRQYTNNSGIVAKTQQEYLEEQSSLVEDISQKNETINAVNAFLDGRSANVGVMTEQRLLDAGYSADSARTFDPATFYTSYSKYTTAAGREKFGRLRKDPEILQPTGKDIKMWGLAYPEAQSKIFDSILAKNQYRRLPESQKLETRGVGLATAPPTPGVQVIVRETGVAALSPAGSVGESLYYNPQTQQVSTEYSSFPLYVTDSGALTLHYQESYAVAKRTANMQGIEGVHVEGVPILDRIYKQNTLKLDNVQDIDGLYEASISGALPGIEVDVEEVSTLKRLKDSDLQIELQEAMNLAQSYLMTEVKGVATPIPLDIPGMNSAERYRLMKSSPIYDDLSFGEKINLGLTFRAKILKESVSMGFNWLVGLPAAVKEGPLKYDTVAGSAAHLAINLLSLGGVESVRKVMPYTAVADWSRDELLGMREANAARLERYIKNTDSPQAKEFYEAQLEALQKKINDSKINNASRDASIANATTGLRNAWENFVKQINQGAEVTSGRFDRAIDAWTDKNEDYRNSASMAEKFAAIGVAMFRDAQLSDSLIETQINQVRDKSMDYLEAGNYDLALESTKLALELERTYNFRPSRLDAYTWPRQPEQYEGFIEALAQFEIRKGSPATLNETRAIKNLFVNAWTEGVGEAIFDPLNLVPASVMDKALEPVKGFFGAMKSAATASDVSIIRWLAGDSVKTTANKMFNEVVDTGMLMLRASDTGALGLADDAVEVTIKEFEQVGNVVHAHLERGLDYNISELYKEAIEVAPSVENLSERQFKRLVDSVTAGSDSVRAATLSRVGPSKWGEMLSTALDDLKSELESIARLDILSTARGTLMTDVQLNEVVTRLVAERLADPEYIARNVFQRFSAMINREFLENSKYFGTNIFRESLSGGIYKFLGDSRGITTGAQKIFSAAVDFGQLIRNLWANAVLVYSPRWTVTNLLDSTTRAAVAGSNPLESLLAIFDGLPANFFDEMGTPPQGLVQTMSRSSNDFNRNIVNRIVSGDAPKPWEYMELARGRAKANLAETVAERADDLSLIDRIKLSVSDRLKTSDFAVVGDAVQDFNTSLEFVLRTRLYAQELYSNVSRMSPELLKEGLEIVDPQLQELATRLWRESEHNPVRIKKIVESLEQGEIARHLITPTELAGMRIANSDLATRTFIFENQNLVDEFFAGFRAAGKEPTVQDVENFFEAIKEKVSIEFQESISNSPRFNLADGEVNPASAKFVEGRVTPIHKVGDEVYLPDGRIAKVTEVYENSGRYGVEGLETTFDGLDLAPTRKVEPAEIQESVAKEKVLQDAKRIILESGEFRRSLKRGGEAAEKLSDYLGPKFVYSKVATVDEIPVKVVDKSIVRLSDDAEIGILRGSRRTIKLENADGVEVILKLNDKGTALVDDTPFVKFVSDKERKSWSFQVSERFDSLSPADKKKVLIDATKDALLESNRFDILQIQTATGVTVFPSDRAFLDSLNNLLDNPIEFAQISPVKYNAIAGLLDDNPSLLKAYESMSGKTIDISQARISLESMNERIRAELAELGKLGAPDRPASLEVTGKNLARTSAEWHNTITKLSQAEKVMLSSSMNSLDSRYNAVSSLLFEYMRDVFPGPKTYAGQYRATRWSRYFSIQERIYNAEIAAKRDILSMISSGDKFGASKLIGELNSGDNLLSATLRDAGFDVKMYSGSLNNIESVKYVEGGVVRELSPYEVSRMQDQLFSRKSLSRINTEHFTAIEYSGSQVGQLKTAAMTHLGLNGEQAQVFASMLYNHADEVSRGSEKLRRQYLERFGFVTVGKEKAVELNIDRIGSLVSKDGKFTMFGLGVDSTFDDVIDATSAIFSNDYRNSLLLGSEEELFRLQTLEGYLESVTGVKINNHAWEAVHEQAFADAFRTYLKNGNLGSLKLNQNMHKIKEWMGGVSDLAKTLDIPVEVRAELDSLFPDKVARSIDAKEELIRTFVEEYNLFDNEQVLSRTLEMADSGVGDTTELLALTRRIDDELVEKTLQNVKETGAQLDAVVARVNDIGDVQIIENAHVLKAAQELGISDVPVVFQSIDSEILSSDRLKELVSYSGDAKRSTEEMIRLIDQGRDVVGLPKGIDYEDLTMEETYRYLVQKSEELNIPMAELRAGRRPLNEEIQEMWEAWKAAKPDAFIGWNEDVLYSPSSMIEHIKRRISETSQEAGGMADQYRRLQIEIESFYADSLHYLRTGKSPNRMAGHVADWMLPPGMKTMIAQNNGIMNAFEQTLDVLDVWKRSLISKMNGEDALHAQILSGYTSDELENLREFANWATEASGKMNDVAKYGGELAGQKIEGAVVKTNRQMIDYNATSNLDELAKNIFPFWMFPSRSIGMWAETLATHPEILSGYYKLERMSNALLSQAGMTNSRGEPLESFKGALPVTIAGRTIWINPLSHMSFRYLVKAADDTLNEKVNPYERDESLSPWKKTLSEISRTSSRFGFSPAPWINWMLNPNLQENAQTKWALTPQLSLIPRTMLGDAVRKTNWLTENVIPEVSWHDHLVRLRLMEDAVMYAQERGMTEEEKIEYFSKIEMASSMMRETSYVDGYGVTQQVPEEVTQMWIDAEKATYYSETGRSWFSFMTGMYPKQFSDGRAILLLSRNREHMLKRSMNDELGIEIFNLPYDDRDRWDSYLEFKSSADGIISSMYSNAGWVEEDGNPVYGREEINKAIQANYIEEQYQMELRAAYDAAKLKLDQDLKKAGPLNSQVRSVNETKAYENYFETTNAIFDGMNFGQYYGTNKPTSLIIEDLQEQYMRLLNSTRPEWDEDGDGQEDYLDYSRRVEEWKNRLPQIASSLMPFFVEGKKVTEVISMLKAGQSEQEIMSAIQGFMEISNRQGLDAWQLSREEPVDALQELFRINFFDEYFKEFAEAEGTEHEVIIEKYLEPPSAEQLWQWMVERDPSKGYTLKQVEDLLSEYDTMTMQEKLDEIYVNMSPHEQLVKDTRDLLYSIGTGSAISEPVYKIATRDYGITREEINNLYNSNNPFYGEPDRMARIYAGLQQAMIDAGVTSEYLASIDPYERIQAEELNREFQSEIVAEFGENFFEQQEYYYGLSYSEKKIFRSQNWDVYQNIRRYGTRKDSFADEHPLFAKYYRLDRFDEERDVPDNVAPTLPIGAVTADYLGIQGEEEGIMALGDRIMNTDNPLSEYERAILIRTSELPKYADNTKLQTYIRAILLYDGLNK